jgi:hypothetical protein
MDLSFLIPSKIRRRVLEFWVENPEAQVGIRELSRDMKLSPQQVYRELLNLENWGFLFSSRRGTQRAFRLNKKFPFYPAVSELFRRLKEENSRELKIVKTYNLKEMVRRYRKIPVPPELIPGLTAKRTKPRAWDEEKILTRLAKR